MSQNNHNGVFYGQANVDGLDYPSVRPFIHPPFYDARVKVTLEEGVITKIEDDETGIKGLVPFRDFTQEQLKELFEIKNGPYWNKADQAYLNKYLGKNLDQVKEMKVASGELDSIPGASSTARAIKQAVINAITNQAPKAYLDRNVETLKSEKSSYSTGTKEIEFINSLPADFELKLHSVCRGIYNGDNLIEGVILKENTIYLPRELKAGHYYVNIVDKSGKYRSPDFEEGLGEGAVYPRFVIESDQKVFFKDGKLKIKGDNTLEEVINNTKKITVTRYKEDGSIDKYRFRGEDKPAIYDGDLVTHHGDIGKYKENPLFNTEDGSINYDFTSGKLSLKVFEKGMSHKIEIETFGYGSAETYIDL